jgi:hypothetical protein
VGAKEIARRETPQVSLRPRVDTGSAGTARIRGPNPLCWLKGVRILLPNRARGRLVRDASAYQTATGAVGTSLQSGKRPGDPALLGQWTDAQATLAWILAIPQTGATPEVRIFVRRRKDGRTV